MKKQTIKMEIELIRKSIRRANKELSYHFNLIRRINLELGYMKEKLLTDKQRKEIPCD
jgi:hypothetical protein